MMKLVSAAVVGLALGAMGCQGQPPRPPEAPQGGAQAGAQGMPPYVHGGPAAPHGPGEAWRAHHEGDGDPGERPEARGGGDKARRGRHGPGPMGGRGAGPGPMRPGGGPMGPGGEHAMMGGLAMMGVHFYPPPMLLRRAKEIGLTADQVTKIRQEMLTTQARTIDLHAKGEHTKLEVARLLAADKVDERAVNAQIDEGAKALAELHKLHLGTMLHVRALLTAEQRQKLDERKPARRRGANAGVGPVGQADADADDDSDDDSDDDDDSDEQEG